MPQKNTYKKWIILGLILLFAIITTKIFLGPFSQFIIHSPKIIGLGQEKNYLILFQNDNELRPTGGFISAYGMLTFQNGKFNLTLQDSYALPIQDNLKPAPEAFQKLIKDPKFEGWYFRDSNHNPDFKQAINEISTLYQEQSGDRKEFDGIFAVNFEFLEDLMDLYKIQIDEQIITKANLFSILEHEVKNIDTHNEDSLNNRKNILKDLSQQITKKMIFNIFQYNKLKKTFIQSLEEKKILLYFKDPKIQKIIEKNHWGGQFNPEKYPNYIYTNISNIGGRKADRYINKHHHYFIQFNQYNTPKVTYTLNLKHLGSYNLNSDWYKAYLRTYIPKNALDVSINGQLFNNQYQINEDHIEYYIEMLPSQERTIKIEYWLPEINLENFALKVIKQSGQKSDFHMTIQLPADNTFQANQFEVKENVGNFKTQLTKDLDIKIQIIKDSLPPLVVWQRLENLNTIAINFSEPLNPITAQNINNYQITDLNHINNKTDNISVQKATLKGNTVYLTINGLTRAEEERYQIKLIDIIDQYNNTTEPNPLNITLVQRL